MSQDAILATLAVFGPCTTAELRRCLRQSQQCINDALHRLQKHGEIRFMAHYQDANWGLWVAV